jgi:hypothetical protein
MSIFWLTLMTLPFSPSIYFLILRGNRCFEVPAPLAIAESPVKCLLGITVFAPFFAVFGGLAHDNGPDDNPWLGILLTALIIGVLLAMIRAYLFRRRSAAE